MVSRKKRRQQQKAKKQKREEEARSEEEEEQEEKETVRSKTKTKTALLSLDQAERLANEDSEEEEDEDDDDEMDEETEKTRCAAEKETKTTDAIEDAKMSDDDNENNDDDEEDEDDDDDKESDSGEDDDEEMEDVDDDSEEEEKEDGDDGSEEDEEEGSENNDDDEDPRSKRSRATRVAAVVDQDEHCTLDLRNLLVLNGHQLDQEKMYRPAAAASASSDERCAIPRSTACAVDEDFLLRKTSEGCQKLLAGLWSLPSEKTDVGPLTRLPDHFVVALPREMPPPPLKAETRWEKFAKERGIAPKGKRSRKVFDETVGEWRYLTGRQKAGGSASDEWPIMEVGGNDDPYADPWEKKRDERRAKVEKNLENRLRNREKAGLLPKGTASRTVKSRAAAVTRGKEGNAKDVIEVRPTHGVPVDLRPNKRSDAAAPRQRGAELTTGALRAAQRSTASLGTFDRVREGEPERAKPIRRRRFDPVTGAADAERDRGRKVLERVLSGGRKRDLEIRRGAREKGETAYDYDYDDGLGPSSFKKKKGRAGAGKMRKMTKKRAKTG